MTLRQQIYPEPHQVPRTPELPLPAAAHPELIEDLLARAAAGLGGAETGRERAVRRTDIEEIVFVDQGDTSDSEADFGHGRLRDRRLRAEVFLVRETIPVAIE